jgi:hypothetical protein
MDLVEVGWGDVDWIALAQDRDRWRALVNSVLNLFHAGKLSSVLSTCIRQLAVELGSTNRGQRNSFKNTSVASSNIESDE